MTGELEALGRRAVACKGWRWMPTTSPGLSNAVANNGTRVQMPSGVMVLVQLEAGPTECTWLAWPPVNGVRGQVYRVGDMQ